MFYHLSVCQTSGRMDAELEEEKPKRGSPSPDPPQPKAQAPVTASPESQAQECSPEGNPEKGDCSGQTKALWKPIPPLQPQDGPGHATKDQSCQTEERLQDSQDPCSHTPGTPAQLSSGGLVHFHLVGHQLVSLNLQDTILKGFIFSNIF